MPLTKQKKQKSIKDLKEKFTGQKSVVLADFSKVSSKELFRLRKKLKEAGCLLKVGKKTLMRVAFGQAGLSFWNKIKAAVPGQLALVFSFEDEIAPAKIAGEFAKKQENFKILGGIFEHQFIDRNKVLELASLPTKPELLGKIIWSLQSPLSGLVNLFQANTRSLVSVLSQIKK